MDTSRISRILLTHYHPDHMGLAGWLQQRHPKVVVHASQRTLAAWDTMYSAQTTDGRVALAAYLSAHGMPDAEAAAAQVGQFRSQMPLATRPRVEETLQDGQALTLGGHAWTAIEVHGHADGHICLYCEELGVLISGDQVLPTISPNISVQPGLWGQDPLGAYLQSLERLSALPEQTLVLPSHGRPFRGLRRRARDLIRHHEETLADLERQLKHPKSASDISLHLYGPRLRGFNRVMGLWESVAHLERLIATERAQRELSTDGVYRYRL